MKTLGRHFIPRVSLVVTLAVLMSGGGVEAQQPTVANQAPSPRSAGKQSQILPMDGYSISAFWGASQPPGLLQVSIARAKGMPGILAGEIKIKVFDHQQKEIEFEPTMTGKTPLAGVGDSTSSTAIALFKIKGENPGTPAKVEVTYKKKVHVLEFQGAPTPKSD